MSRSVESVWMKIAGGQEDDYLESFKSVRLWKFYVQIQKVVNNDQGYFQRVSFEKLKILVFKKCSVTVNISLDIFTH